MQKLLKEWNPKADVLPDEFFTLPVYQSWPNAWPEDSQAVRFQFSAANPYFIEGKAWVGLIPGKARMAAFWKPDQEFNGKKVAYFGFWETIDQADATRELYLAAKKWAKDQGAELISGPVNFSTFGNYRIRIDGSVTNDILAGEPFNPPYYQKILAELGLDSVMRYETVIIPKSDEYIAFLKGKCQDRKHPAYEKFQIHSLDQKTWQERMPEFHELTMTFFQGAAGFKPISLEVFRQVYGPTVGQRQCPKTTMFMTTPEGRIIAYFLTFPNYGAVIRRDAPFTPLKPSELSYEKAFPLMNEPELVIKTIGIHPEFRGQGLQHVWVAETALRGFEAGYVKITSALMREGNPSARTYPNLPLERRIYLLYGEALEAR